MPRVQQVLHATKSLITRVLDNVKAIECAITALCIWWSFILALPTDTFSTSTAYRAMAHFASEGTWSIVFLIIGLMMFFGMVFERFWIRMVGLVAAAAIWIFVSAMMAVAELATTGTGVYFIVFCLTTYVIYKVGEQRGR